MELKKITEGGVLLNVPNPEKYRLTSKMPVFFNPVMKLNRDISIVLLRSLKRKLKCLDLLSATGARGLRISKEVPKATVTLNDANPSAVKLIKKNAELNHLKVEISHFSANSFLRDSNRKWNYIDIDPFGTPVPFLENAVIHLSSNGNIGVTATDTSALCGTYPKACTRKYNSVSLRCPQMHEMGLRILIHHIQEIGRKQKVHLKPVFSHSTRHYMRVYLKRVRQQISNEGYFKYNFKTGDFSTSRRKPRRDFAGPLWLGPLWDEKLVRKMQKDSSIPLVDIISHEMKIKTVGFYDIHALAKIYKVEHLPKFGIIIKNLRKRGFRAERTHITPTGIKTNAKIRNVLDTFL